jgi:hypothetical protein
MSRLRHRPAQGIKHKSGDKADWIDMIVLKSPLRKLHAPGDLPSGNGGVISQKPVSGPRLWLIVISRFKGPDVWRLNTTML